MMLTKFLLIFKTHDSPDKKLTKKNIHPLTFHLLAMPSQPGGHPLCLPLLIPSISSVILLRSIEMWKEFIFPFVLAGQYNLFGTLIESLYNNWGYSHEAAAVALILVACTQEATAASLMACRLQTSL